MNRFRAIFAFAIAALLSACITLPERPAAPSVYDFGDAAPRIAAEGAWRNVVLDVRAPAWLDSPGIAYRLGYDDPLRWRLYADSRWSERPAALLSQSLRQQLGMVAAFGTPSASCQLQVELQTFSQLFSTPQESRGILQATAVLLDSKRQILAERRFLIERKAETPNARGGVQALAGAGSELGQQMLLWLESERSAQKCQGTK